jgi:hypothetical protein
VKALKHRIDLLQAEAAQAEPALPKGLLVVLSKQNVSATLKDARLRALGGRTFVVGMEVEGPQITRPRFAGMVVWIPLNDIIQMVELKDGKQGP